MYTRMQNVTEFRNFWYEIVIKADAHPTLFLKHKTSFLALSGEFINRQVNAFDLLFITDSTNTLRVSGHLEYPQWKALSRLQQLEYHCVHGDFIPLCTLLGFEVYVIATVIALWNADCVL
jgi:hypothetical protein